MDITEIDKNFIPKTVANQSDIVWYSILNEPFSLYGLLQREDVPGFCRLPQETARQVSPEVLSLFAHTAGGRVRFSTDSPYIALAVALPSVVRFSHMPLTGTSGFDLYLDEAASHRHMGTFIPNFAEDTCYNGLVDLTPRGLREGVKSYTVNFPLYNEVTSVYIGVKAGSVLAPGAAYRAMKPFVYYGSSITQGGCASRPGTCYQSYLCNRFDVDYVNLGFSGSAKGEPAMAEYIASLPMSLFVLDYDHNAPDVDHLQKTHAPFYERFRRVQPDTPILLITRPNVLLAPRDAAARRRVVLSTYETARSHGDEHIYFLDGAELFGDFLPDACTVDYIHPNDLGFYRMAQRIGDAIDSIPGLF